MTTETLRLSASVFCERLSKLWERGRRMGLRIGRRAPKRLRLCESLPLGERRFVAVVEFEAARFLVGGTAASLVLLSRLPAREPDQRPDQKEDADEAENEFEPGAEAEKKRRGEKC
jgi:flagellar biogenesis protein FliO